MSTVKEQPKFNDFRKLMKCVADLIRCKGYLGASAAQSVEALENLVRKMEVSAVVQQRHTIAVAGMQGTGKSTLIKNLYGLPENFLRVNSNRGERVPVFITEKKELETGHYSAKRVYFDENLCKLEEEIQPKEVGKWSSGRDHTAYVELFVPARYFYTDQASFALLPGFEKTQERMFDEDYNSLMEYTLHFANAVVLVTKEDGLANADLLVLLEKLGKNFSPHNCIFAITSCDGVQHQKCCEMVETLLTSCDECGLVIHREQIVCTGEYRTKEENQRWQEEIVNAIEYYLDYHSTKKTYDYFLPMIEEIEEYAAHLRTALDAHNLLGADAAPHYALLEDALEKSEKELERFLNSACAAAKPKVAKRFQSAYGAIPGKHKTNKRLLFFNKKYETIAEDRDIIRRAALGALKSESDGKGELIHQVQILLPQSVFYQKAKMHSLLLTGQQEVNELSVQEQQQITVCNQVIRGYLDVTAPRVKNLECSDRRAVEIVTNEFNTYFLSMLVGNIDPGTVPLRTEGIQATMKNIQKMAGRKKSSMATAVTLVDLLDGKSDIMQAVLSLFMDAGKAAEVASVASGWAVVTIAGVALAKKGLDLYNQVIANQNAIGETWEYALMNVLEEQRNNILDSYREAADKLLEHVQRVHEERMGIDAKRSRITDAQYALAGIAAISNSFHDQYAEILEKRASN